MFNPLNTPSRPNKAVSVFPSIKNCLTTENYVLCYCKGNILWCLLPLGGIYLQNLWKSCLDASWLTAGMRYPGHSTSGLWLDVMVLQSFVLGNVVHKGMVRNICFVHSRWLTQINLAVTESGSTVLTSWWLPAACLNRADDSQWCSWWAMSPSFKIILNRQVISSLIGIFTCRNENWMGWMLILCCNLCM